MKLLLLDERYPRELLAGFEVVTAPQDDVVAVLTMPERRVDAELCARLPALRVVGTATVGFDHVEVPPREVHPPLGGPQRELRRYAENAPRRQFKVGRHQTGAKRRRSRRRAPGSSR